MLFQHLLKSVVRQGSLKLVTVDGTASTFGDGGPPRCTVRLHRKSLEWTLGLHPDLYLGEAYMKGLLTIEEGDIFRLLHLLLSNARRAPRRPLRLISGFMDRFLDGFDRLNSLARSKKNVSFHYDMPDMLYQFFLDPDRSYSCGYFKDSDNTLEDAQNDKKRLVTAKLFIDRPGLGVLDIGSGWGGLGLYLASAGACHVKGLTLSDNQLRISQARALKAGLSDRCRFASQDYRQESGRYDRIVSVGMFEHVGKKSYRQFFEQVQHLLAPDGIALIHTIGRTGAPARINAFIRKHIFPGAAVPTLDEVARAITPSGLYVTDVEILRLHYAETLKRWRQRWQTYHADIVDLFDETLYRKWLFYFAGCEAAFRTGDLVVFQIQLSKRFDTLPITRRYMHDWEAPIRQDEVFYASSNRMSG